MCKRAKAEDYRSRAAYKLLELDERFGLLKGVKAVVDLGIAPGGWSQVVRRRVAAGARSSASTCCRPTRSTASTILQMDFMDDAAPDRLREALGGPADLVLSDMAANTVGHPQTDHLRTMGLVEAALEFAAEVLRPGGAFVAKVLAGGADNQLVAELKRHFTTVKHAKPPASRKGSSEWYVVAQGFKGARATTDSRDQRGQPRSADSCDTLALDVGCSPTRVNQASSLRAAVGGIGWPMPVARVDVAIAADVGDRERGRPAMPLRRSLRAAARAAAAPVAPALPSCRRQLRAGSGSRSAARSPALAPT